jgi:hypothetical protein
VDRARLDEILSGKRSLKSKAPAEPVVIKPSEMHQASARLVAMLATRSAGARPIALASSQLPAIF